MRRQWPLLAALAGLLVTASAPAPSAPQIDPRIAPLFAPDQGEPRAALLIEDGQLVAKHYAPGYSDANRFISWSMAKTVTAMLVGALVSDGRLQLDAPAPIDEWHRPGDPRAQITLRQLLAMASGLRHIEVGEPIEHSDTNQVLFVGGTQDMAARAIAQPLETPPGSQFKYSSLTTIILAEIITRTLTDSRDPRVRAKVYRDFAYQRLFTPAGITTAFPEFDGSGTQIGGSIIHMSLDDWGRMGRLLLDGTGANGQQVVAPEWLAFMKMPSATNPEYGAQTWLNRPTKGPDAPALFPGKGPDTLVSMIGHLGQYVMAFQGPGPDGALHRYVLVRLGKTQDDGLAPVRRALGKVVDALVPAAPSASTDAGPIDPRQLAKGIAQACGVADNSVTIDAGGQVHFVPSSNVSPRARRCVTELLDRHGLHPTPVIASL